MQAVLRALPNVKDAAKRGEQFTRFIAQVETLAGPLETIQRLSRPPYSELTSKPVTPAQLAETQEHAKKVMGEFGTLVPQVAGAKARQRMRDIAKENGGTFSYLRLLLEMKSQLATEETESAFDSELALVWWKDGYARYRWHTNPLYYRVRRAGPAALAGLPAGADHTLMVMRIDAPTERLAHDLIETSVRVEQEGLKGVVALDARGKPPSDPYGQYDQTIRNLAELLKAKTKLTVVLDDKEALFPKDSVKDVALYNGWYSLRHYVPGMKFNPGAVGFHVASSELVALHHPGETGWVHGLMTDGVVATLGPVAEPYLHSFPPADEFFPLLLTGKLTLAEVYWSSNPLVSWMNTCIGDPLYKPYATNPALKAEDLPAGLGAVLK